MTILSFSQKCSQSLSFKFDSELKFDLESTDNPPIVVMNRICKMRKKNEAIVNLSFNISYSMGDGCSNLYLIEFRLKLQDQAKLDSHIQMEMVYQSLSWCKAPADPVLVIAW